MVVLYTILVENRGLSTQIWNQIMHFRLQITNWQHQQYLHAKTAIIGFSQIKQKSHFTVTVATFESSDRSVTTTLVSDWDHKIK